MPILTWCWRCQMDIPMLDEEEWQQMAPYLSGALSRIKEYRERTGRSLAEAWTAGLNQPALAMYAQITGFEETNINAIHHHRRSLYGPDCVTCGKPLRTERASFCAACGSRPAASLAPGDDS